MRSTASNGWCLVAVASFEVRRVRRQLELMSEDTFAFMHVGRLPSTSDQQTALDRLNFFLQLDRSSISGAARGSGR